MTTKTTKGMVIGSRCLRCGEVNIRMNKPIECKCKPQNTKQYGHSVLLSSKILDAQKETNKNLAECLYGPKINKKITPGQHFRRFIREVENRISNAYDCLVKGVDPYDGY